MTKVKQFYFLGIFGLFLILSGCSYQNTIEGTYFDYDDIENLISVNMSVDEVINILGTPTLRSTFDEHIVYYTYEIYNNPIKLANKSIKEARVLKLTFNKGKLKDIKLIKRVH